MGWDVAGCGELGQRGGEEGVFSVVWWLWWVVVVAARVGQICGGLLSDGFMWFGGGVWLLRVLWVLCLRLLGVQVLCKGGQELGPVGADEEGGWVGAVVDDELQEVGRQGGGEEEGVH